MKTIFLSRGLVLLLAVVMWIALPAGADDNIGVPEIDDDAEGVINMLKEGLDDWDAEDGREIKNWRYRGGVLVNDRLGPNLITKKEYRDFDLRLDFNLPRGGNSGVYLRGRYEVQLLDNDGNVDDKGATGAIWGQIPVERRAYKGANTWNELAVRLKGNVVTVSVNRVLVIRSRKLTGPTREAMDRNEDGSGPILLQSLRGVRFRNLRIKPL